MNMKGGKVALLIIVFVLAIFIFLSPASAGVFTGVTHGYVKWDNSSIIYQANVTVTVTGCSGGVANGCTGSVLSQSNGYYLIGNLNMIENDNVSLTATYSGSTGCASGIAAGGGVAEVNITMFPGAPTLEDQANTHLTSVSLNWTSGLDPGNSTALYDKYQFNGGGYTIQTSPQVESSLSYQTSYTWNAVTCNSAGCTCTDIIPSDSFTISNSPPPAPTLGDQQGTNETSVLLNWTSGGADPDGDAVTFQYQFGIDEIYTITNNSATSPQNETLSGVERYTWRVRACDNTSASNNCSSWATDDFISTTPCPDAPVCPPSGGGGGGSGGVTRLPSYVASISAPLYINQGKDVLVFANYKSDRNTDSVELKITGNSAISFTPVNITNLPEHTEKTVIIRGKVADDADLKDYELLFTATKGNEIVVTKHFITSVVEEPVVGPPKEIIKVVPYFPWWILLIITTAAILIAGLLARYKDEKANLVRYIKGRLRKGRHPRRIHRNLSELGWMESTLHGAFREANVEIRKLESGIIKYFKIKKIKV